MHPGIFQKMAIITPFGLYEFLRMGFGMRNAGNTFQRMMDRVGSGLCFIFISVADPHHFDADPDPAFHFDADPDPDPDVYPDPDPGSGSYCQLGMVKKKFLILVNNKTQMG